MSESSPVVFISYRREDANWATDLLFERLEKVLGQELLFRDINNISPGDDFRDEIYSSVEKCSMMLVMVGPNWLEAKHSDGSLRLHDTEDWVRIEIESGLAGDLKMIPVLLYPAEMPPESSLPESLSKIPYLNALTIYPGDDFQFGFEKLKEAIVGSLTDEQRASLPQTDKVPGKSSRSISVLPRILWTAGSILLICLIVGLFFIGSDNPSPEIIQQRNTIAEQYADKVGKWFEKRFELLQQVADSEGVSSNQPELQKEALMKLARQEYFPGGVYALDRQGKILSQATPNHPEMDDLTGLDFSHREYFRECQRRNQPVTTNAIVSANRDEQIIVLAAPRKDLDGLFQGIVDGVVNVGTSSFSMMAQESMDTHEKLPVRLYLIDKNGMVLGSNHKPSVASSFENIGLVKRYTSNTMTETDRFQAIILDIPETPYHVVAEIY